MIVVISLIIILMFLISVTVVICLCKESINWRSENCGYDLEQSIELSKIRVYKVLEVGTKL